MQPGTFRAPSIPGGILFEGHEHHFERALQVLVPTFSYGRDRTPDRDRGSDSYQVVLSAVGLQVLHPRPADVDVAGKADPVDVPRDPCGRLPDDFSQAERTNDVENALRETCCIDITDEHHLPRKVRRLWR